MAVITKPNTFSAGATIIASEHNDNFDTIYNEFNGNIDNANIKSAAGIAGSKLAQITEAAKVHGSSLTGLGSIDTATAGQIPGAAIDTGVTAGKIIAVATGALLPTVDGRNLTNLSATAVSNLGNITAAQGIIPSANINTGNTANKILYVDTGDYYPAIDGRNITRLNATNLSSGTVATGRLGSGTADTTTYLRGDSAWSALPKQVTQANDVETTGVSYDDDPEVTFLTLQKTVTSGNTVFLTASGYLDLEYATLAPSTTLKLKYGATIVHTSIIYTKVSSDGVRMPWALCSIVTGLSGANTFCVTAQTNVGNPNEGGTAYGNLIVLEF